MKETEGQSVSISVPGCCLSCLPSFLRKAAACIRESGSLFQGGLGREERSRSDPPRGRSPPSIVVKRPFDCWGVTLRSSVSALKVVPNDDRFGRNLAGMIFGTRPTAGFANFFDWPPGVQVSYSVRKVKILASWPFSMDFDNTKGS